MHRTSRFDRILVFMGDVVLFYITLFLALFIRYPQGPTQEILRPHLIAFSILFGIWIIVFLIAGLYDKHIRVSKNRLPSTILKVQTINSLLAVVFFYAVPSIGIAPKTTIFLYLVISFVLITIWRIYGPLLFGNNSEEAIFVASGTEPQELVTELKHYKGYPLSVAHVIDTQSQTDIVSALRQAILEYPDANVIVGDLEDPKIEPALGYIYQLVSKQYLFLPIHDVYEDVFNRLPVSLLDERWLIGNVTLLPSKTYDLLKRTVDIVMGGIAFIISLPFYVLAFILIKLDDGGPLYFVHERVGQNNKRIKIVKFRSMAVHNEQNGLSKDKKITRVGPFLRKSRIDELPQLWNVVRGDLSLIGPRSELPQLVELYEKDIPYYGLRHVVKPGLSGWAQISQKTPPKFAADIELTKQKVSYDLYYIKHRSFMLDVLIALKTVKELISSRGI